MRRSWPRPRTCIEAAGGRMVSRPADVARPGRRRGARRRSSTSSSARRRSWSTQPACSGPIAIIRDTDPRPGSQTVMIDAIAPYLTTRQFVGGMIDAGWGRIVNVTSAASLHPPGPLNSAYGTAKVALNQLTRHLAAEIDGTGRDRQRHPPGRRQDRHVAGHPRPGRGDGARGRAYTPVGGLGRGDRRRSARTRPSTSSCA